MYGHAADFSWIAGSVQHDLSCFYLNFGDGNRSLWGGRIVLSASPDQMSALRNGDTVVVKGELMRLGYGSCGALSYTVATIEEH